MYTTEGNVHTHTDLCQPYIQHENEPGQGGVEFDQHLGVCLLQRRLGHQGRFRLIATEAVCVCVCVCVYTYYHQQNLHLYVALKPLRFAGTLHTAEN